MTMRSRRLLRETVLLRGREEKLIYSWRGRPIPDHCNDKRGRRHSIRFSDSGINPRRHADGSSVHRVNIAIAGLQGGHDKFLNRRCI